MTSTFVHAGRPQQEILTLRSSNLTVTILPDEYIVWSEPGARACCCLSSRVCFWTSYLSLSTGQGLWLSPCQSCFCFSAYCWTLFSFWNRCLSLLPLQLQTQPPLFVCDIHTTHYIVCTVLIIIYYVVSRVLQLVWYDIYTLSSIIQQRNLTKAEKQTYLACSQVFTLWTH